MRCWFQMAVASEISVRLVFAMESVFETAGFAAIVRVLLLAGLRGDPKLRHHPYDYR
jgi:hypothetical protein